MMKGVRGEAGAGAGCRSLHTRVTTGRGYAHVDGRDDGIEVRGPEMQRGSPGFTHRCKGSSVGDDYEKEGLVKPVQARHACT